MKSLELSPLKILPLQRGALDWRIAAGEPVGPVKRVQELLCWAAGRDPAKFGACATGIDGDFGPGTEGALIAFQRNAGAGLEASGKVDAATWDALRAPIERMLNPPPALKAASIGETVVAIGDDWLKLRPVEFKTPHQGGNVGLVVRAVMTRPENRGKAWGPEGDDYKWCAGAISTLEALAAEMHCVVPRFPYSWSCPEMGAIAASRRQLVRGDDPAVASKVKPGDIFLSLPKPNEFRGQYPHTGIVGGQLANGRFRSLEGNSDPAGGYNGISFLERTRSVANCDFIAL